MKRILIASVVLCGLLAFGIQAQALSIDPNNDPFLSGLETSQAQIDAIIAEYIGSSLELYKNDFGGGDSGPLAGSYNTVYNALEDPTGAIITYTGGLFVGPTAYLLVKDGAADPAWYLFNLTELGWTGTEILELTGFWEGVQGSISHVALYGSSNPVPEPGTLLLIGSGLAGLAAYKRRKKA
jgi:hypothetical protein